MNYDDYKDSIFIVKDEAKERIIKDINNSKKLLNIKVITLSELKKKFYFDYDNKAIHAVSRKFNVVSEIAKMYIENIYYFVDIDEEKVKFLKTIKMFLDDNKLITYNRLFHKFLTNKKIVLLDLGDVDKFYENIFIQLKSNNEIIELSSLKNHTKKTLIKAKNKDEEIALVASQICTLIKNGVDINLIKLANVKEDYVYTIKNIFKAFNIPVFLPSESAIGSIILAKFVEFYNSNMEKCFDKLKKYIHSNRDQKLYDSLIRIINDYAWCDDYLDVKDEILEEIKKLKLPNVKYKNSVSIIDFENDIIGDEYIFLVNFNLGIIPICAKDEDFLPDAIKRKLNISDSIEINKKRIEYVKKRILGTKNLFVSYSESDLNGKLYISSAFEEEMFEECNCNIDYTSSNSYNKQRLVCALDDYKKFGIVDKYLPLLHFNYSNLPYESYDNRYSAINKLALKKYLNNHLTLSYTSVDTYFKCAYRYYLEYILKLSEFETRMETSIGNIFHKVLSRCYENDFDFESEYEQACLSEEYEFNTMEKYFLNKLKQNLKKIIDVLYTQEDYTLLKKKLFERRIIVPIDEKNGVIFKGFIDKIIYDDFDEKTIAAIIDYKTGNADIDLKNIEYGLSMQLPAYAYLLKKDNKFENAKIGGFYLQKLFEDEKLKLSGYSNSEFATLEKVDNTYLNSKLINNLKVSQNGFYKYAKILTDAEIEEICNLVEEKIKEAAKNILDAKFDINPKEIKGNNLSCKFCEYKSICFMKNEDIMKIGGSNDAKMD